MNIEEEEQEQEEDQEQEQEEEETYDDDGINVGVGDDCGDRLNSNKFFLLNSYMERMLTSSACAYNFITDP